jgi:NitT/TauT family transport system substrate-binding protein
MSGFLKGECDACLSGEFPVVKQSFERNDITIIATVSSSENAVKILARKDRGISKPIDLIGKKVGISKGTISNFFFDQFLKKNGISPKKLTIVDIPHNKVSDALKRGEIDAFAGSDVAYLKGRHLIGDTGVTFTEPGLTNHAACLTVKKDWLAANPDTAQRVLKALVTAEKELAGNSDEIPPMLAKELDTSVEDIKTIMADQHNKVSIDQVLILALEDEARWMLEMGMLKGKQVPNYLDFIDVSVLKKVNPDAVKLR